MKNFIGIIVTLGIVAFFFPLYSMELVHNSKESIHKTCLHSIEVKDLRNINPLSDMNELPISRSGICSISSNDQLRTDKGLG